MASKNGNGSARLPLIEAVIIIAVFAIVSVAVMRMYVAADSLKGESVAISHATILARNKVEAIQSGAELLPNEAAPGITLSTSFGSPLMQVSFYDSDWNMIEVDDGSGFVAGSDEYFPGALYRMSVYENGIREGAGETLTDFTVEVIRLDKEQGTKDNPLISISSSVIRRTE